MKDLKEFISTLRARFHERLEAKTGWGKEELKREFELALSDALMAIVSGFRERSGS